MQIKLFAPFIIVMYSCLLFSTTVSSAYADDPEPSQSADSLYQYATSLLASGDTTRATAILDLLLKLDKKNYEALLVRGRLYLAAGDNKQAKLTFRDVLFSKSKQIRSRAYVGLGDVKATAAHRVWDVIIDEYRMAIRLDPTNLECYYVRANAALRVDDPNGYRIASDMFLHIICENPDYKDAYVTWREAILDKSREELRQVTGCLESYIESHPEKSHWLYDIAEYSCELGNIQSTLDALSRLSEAAPEYKPPERHLLIARCKVELNDTLGFEKAYRDALSSAEQDGDFKRLAAHAEAIFRPEEQAKADSMETAEQWADYFSVFWNRRDPDPLTPHNERLYEHYWRLSYARENWPLIDVYSRTRESRILDRVETMLNWNAVGGRAYDVPDADPDIYWDRCPELNLQQRGLLFVRHGPPDLINKPIMEDGPRLNEEVWFYGGIFFPFREGGSSIGDYRYVPVYAPGMGNIRRSMETESFTDPLPKLKQDYYATEFMAEGELLEVEVYQSLSADQLEGGQPEGVSIAVFDNSWRELARDSSSVLKAEFDNREHWVGMNRVLVNPGEVMITARLDAPRVRAIRRRGAELYPFRIGTLELSGAVLGSPVPLSGGTHSRLGVELLPRPSLTYTSGEIMTVYFELYGLRAAADGAIKFVESVTIVRNAGEEGVFGKVRRLLTTSGRERTSSLTLTFERQREGTLAAVAEYFTVDTSLLLPGDYQMLIEVRDINGSGTTSKVACSFTLVEPE